MVDISTLETIGEGTLDVGLSIASMMFPAAGAVFAIVKEAVPALIAARPYIIKAVQDGKSAFEAAEAASPGLGAKIVAIAKNIPVASDVITWSEHLDHVTATSVHVMYEQNLKDSGYNPADDFDAAGNMKVGG